MARSTSLLFMRFVRTQGAPSPAAAPWRPSEANAGKRRMVNRCLRGGIDRRKRQRRKADGRTRDDDRIVFLLQVVDQGRSDADRTFVVTVSSNSFSSIRPLARSGSMSLPQPLPEQGPRTPTVPPPDRQA